MDTAYLCFRIREHRYAIENQAIIRIMPSTTLYPLPIEERGIKGLVMLDDQLVGILDLEEWLWNHKTTSYPLMIFVEAGSNIFGICAEDIEGLHRINEHEWVENERTDLPFRYQQKEDWIYLIDLLQLQGREYHDQIK